MPQALGELKKLQEAVNEVYLLNDPYITKVVVAALISHRIKGDPVWIVLVAPSGGGKSEFINMLSKCEGVLPLSTLSSHTFVSGQRKSGQETSLLMKIQNGIITFKDLTSLLSENKDDRSVIMGQLREIYDGKYNKAFGNGENVDWEGKITVIAGATHVIHSMRQSYSAMGERFLFYEIIQPEPKAAADKTMTNQEEGKMAEHRLDLAESMRHYADELIEIPEKLPKIPKELREELIDLADLATKARSAVERNYRAPDQPITEVHPPEMPTRFSGQLINFARGLMITNWNEIGTFDLTDNDRKALFKLALDSITSSRRRALQELAKYTVLETSGLAIRLGFPTQTARIWMQDLTALGVAEREKGTGAKGDRWNILPRYRELISKFENIKPEDKELTEANAEEEPATEEKVNALLETMSEEEKITAGLF